MLLTESLRSRISEPLGAGWIPLSITVKFAFRGQHARHPLFLLSVCAYRFRDLVFSCAIPGIAQVDRSALTGTVTDPSGRLLGQTHVTVVENSTQSEREGVSDNAGRYDIPELPVGRYTVKFDHPGFQTLTFLDVEQVVGRTRSLDATLQISGGEERVEVSVSSELLDRNTAAVTGLIERSRPTNCR